MSDSKIFITTKARGRIPFINRNGPILRPISISVDIFNQLVKLGYQIESHDKENITIDTDGNRVLITEATFVAATETDVVEVVSQPAPIPFEPNPVSIPDEKQLEAPVVVAESFVEPTSDKEEVTTEETSEKEEEVAEETSASEIQEEEHELPVFDEETYRSWTKAAILEYLTSAEAFLPEEVFASLSKKNKEDLLIIVKEYIIDVANSQEE